LAVRKRAGERNADKSWARLIVEHALIHSPPFVRSLCPRVFDAGPRLVAWPRRFPVLECSRASQQWSGDLTRGRTPLETRGGSTSLAGRTGRPQL
jgi:hypothetical protein